jgi:hypothetical protein
MTLHLAQLLLQGLRVFAVAIQSIFQTSVIFAAPYFFHLCVLACAGLLNLLVQHGILHSQHVHFAFETAHLLLQHLYCLISHAQVRFQFASHTHQTCVTVGQLSLHIGHSLGAARDHVITTVVVLTARSRANSIVTVFILVAHYQFRNVLFCDATNYHLRQIIFFVFMRCHFMGFMRWFHFTLLIWTYF